MPSRGAGSKPLAARAVAPACLALVLGAAATLTACSSGSDEPTVELDGVKACGLLTKAQLKSYEVSTVTLDTDKDGVSVCEWGAAPSPGRVRFVQDAPRAAG
ncbi:hypothetical protein [Streptomyces sp. NRRL F-5123]|uniref:hypothetical protein n=1 Tax=Streptomyces sp. NRRL F-5123 TaxID=1463856 RepID=UPI0004E25019|nr:hypothetical protein [Streptomyces sp. NRRL F-5123]